MDLTIRRRVLKNGLVLATTLITCTALQANEQENQTPGNAGAPQSSERATSASDRNVRSAGQDQGKAEHGDQQKKFVHKALKGGQMEVKVGQLAQQKGQNQEVKTLGQRLVQDHTQANQKLQQIAQSLNISATEHEAQGHDAGKQAKHEQAMSKLQNQSGAEFDKEFVKMALKHHKKSIAEFERAQQQVNDQQLKSFIQETLPKLRQHLQMAQSAARNVGVDESSLAIEGDYDSDSATGAPAARESGTERPEGSIDVDTDVDKSDDSASVDVDADTDNKVFQKGDGKVLGLPTSKTDGTYLGIIPKPGADNDDDVDVDVDADPDASIEADINRDNDASIGGAARSESGTSTDTDADTDRDLDIDVDADKR